MPCQILGGKVRSISEKMIGDKEIMSMVQQLRNDPAFKGIPEEPESMQAVNSDDVATLTSNPRFMNLLNNSTPREIQSKVK
jgi:hypothetical protein